MALISKPLPTNPELNVLLERSVARWKAMTPTEQRELAQAQRKSWVIGEMMLEYPDMTRDRAEELFNQII